MWALKQGPQWMILPEEWQKGKWRLVEDEIARARAPSSPQSANAYRLQAFKNISHLQLAGVDGIRSDHLALPFSEPFAAIACNCMAMACDDAPFPKCSR